MRVAIYARVSAKDQRCEIQLAELRAYVPMRAGWTLVNEYVDHGISGAKGSRPALDELLHAASLREFDCVVCTKLDRWGRSVMHLVESLKRLTDYRVRFICINQGVDTDRSNPTSQFLLHILAAVAELERSLIRERCSAGHQEYARKVKAGEPLESRSKRNLPIGRQPKIFERWRVPELRAQGLSWDKIAMELGVSAGTVRNVFRELRPAEEPAQAS